MSKAIEWLKKHYMLIAAPVGAYSLYRIVDFFSGSGVKRAIAHGKYSSAMKFPLLMDAILKGEAKGYNDHNYYTTSGLKGYVEGSWGQRYPLFTKPLSEYTLGEIMSFQSKPTSQGRLWAIGQYQIITPTLADIYSKAGLKWTDKLNKVNQDKLGMQLIAKRPNLKKYLYGEVPDTDANLKRAAMDVAMEWSSVGVPYAVAGHWQNVAADQSYYHPKDRGTTSTASIQKALRLSRLKK
jgi:hypothetical protein